MYKIQVSLAIRGGYVPKKYQTANNKTGILGPNKANLDKKLQFSLVVRGFRVRE
jgi:hypothetical protein